MKNTSARIWDYGIFLILAALTLAVFARVGNFEFFAFDDWGHISENPHVQNGLTKAGVSWAFTSLNEHWVPVTRLSHMVSCQIFGLHSGGHHVMNLILHVLNTLLLFGVLRRMTGRRWCSAFVAALFAVHPLHVESVAWVVERKDVLSAFFFLLALWAYDGYVRKPLWGRYIPVLFLFVLGVMSKPMVVTFPFVLLLLDYWPLGRGSKESWKQLCAEKMPLIVLSGLFCLVAYCAQQTTGAVAPLANFPLALRVGNAFAAYAGYLWKTLWPARLAFYYPHPGISLPATHAAVAVLLFCAVTYGAMKARRSTPYLWVGWLWFAGMLVPAIGILQVGMQAMADRYTYLPLVGLFVAAVWGISDVWKRWGWSRWVLGILGALAIALLALTAARQVAVWRNTKTLCSHALAVVPNNWMAHRVLGVTLERKSLLNAAQVHYLARWQISPHSSQAQVDMGNVLFKRQKYRRSEARFREALNINPDFVEARRGLAMTLERLGKTQEAFAHYEQILPEGDAGDFAGVANMLAERGKHKEAAEFYSQALKMNPNSADIHYNFANMLTGQGRYADAMVHYVQACRLKPTDPDAYTNMGLLYDHFGRVPQALYCYEKAVALDPNHPEAHCNWGGILARQGKWEEAAFHYRRALQSRPQFEGALRGLEQVLKMREAARAGTASRP
ncbi:MAG: tetratricopeptide repeat protein [Candidatus Omnitrophica bacterium]|nr:tetratricopeptide repeat protein [Candidatus Omnitrophota bacterium]